MSEIIGYTISARNGTRRKFLATDSASGYPYLSTTGIHRTFDTQDEADAWLVNNSNMVSSDGIPEVVEILINVVSTLASIDPIKVARNAALAKLTAEDRKALGL